jgi:ubiquinone biosynthesis protein UbiJ
VEVLGMKTLFLSTLTKAINTYLGLDPESKKHLQKLKGRVATTKLLPFDAIFQLTFTDKGVEIQTEELLNAETTITGTPLQMLGMMLNKSNRNQFFADDLSIVGDAELGRDIVALFDEIQIDWEEHLSQFIGDVPAHHIGRLANRVKSWLNHADTTFTSNINEYLHEETEWLPPREALDDFYNEIDKLRMDVDRIEAKISHLKSVITEQENHQ